MNQDKKERISKITFVLNGFLFLLGSVVFLGDHKIIFGITQAFAGLANLGMLKAKKHKARYFLSYMVFTFNVIVAIITALDYIKSGKEYIQYAWMAVALLSFIALLVYAGKDKSYQPDDKPNKPQA